MTSLKEFRNELKEGMLNFIWRQWCQMGVSGSVQKRDDWVIDPDSVLAFTSEIARYDARVFDEVMDWLLQNGQWINVQRLSTIIKRDSIGDKAVIGAIASWMMEYDKSAKWRGLARRMESERRTPSEALFWSMQKGMLESANETDPHFERYGLIRPVVKTRDMSRSVDMQSGVNAVFKCRALFGIGNRADVMLYLLTTDGGHPRQIAKLHGYNHMRVQELMSGLAQAGAVNILPVGRAKEYWIDKEKWWPAIMGYSEIPRWVDWRSLLRGLTVIWRQIWSIDAERADDYIVSSIMRTAMRNARDDLHASGMGFAIEDDRGYVAEEYGPVYQRTIRALISKIHADS